MTHTGMIFDIQRFSLYDGPGIRTTVFLKGCPLRCPWCHNPEGYAYGPELSYDREACTDSAALCRPGVVEIIGRMYHVHEVMDLVMRDLPFYQAGQGGLTLSGGEPMAQPEFATELAQSAKSHGLHVCLETSGCCETSALMMIEPFVDLFLFDIKETDDAAHKQLTGVGLLQIQANLLALDAAGARIILRCPLIPGCNTRIAHYEGIAVIANQLHHVIGIELEPYHSLGREKGEKLGKPQPLYATPGPDQLKEAIEVISKNTAVPVKSLR